MKIDRNNTFAKTKSRLLVDQQEQQPIEPSPIPQHEAVDGFRANGKINSVIITTSSNWTASGDWNMTVTDGKVEFFTTNMTWTDEISRHTHKFINFKSKDKEIELPPDNIVSIKGNMDIGIGHAISWENVPTIIDIGGGGKTITISIDHEKTDHHFAGQSITGSVISLMPCSDKPGPNMQVLPSWG